MFLIVYFFTRNKKATLILSGILFTAFNLLNTDPTGGKNPVGWVNNGIFVLLGMIAFNRFGIVAVISGIFIAAAIRNLPLSLDPANIVFPQTIATLVIFFAIMAYAAYISIGGAKMFGGKSWLGD